MPAICLRWAAPLRGSPSSPYRLEAPTQSGSKPSRSTQAQRIPLAAPGAVKELFLPKWLFSLSSHSDPRLPSGNVRPKASFQGRTAVLARMMNAGRTGGLRLAPKRSVTGASLKTRRHAFHTPHVPRPTRGHASPAIASAHRGRGPSLPMLSLAHAHRRNRRNLRQNRRLFVIPFSQTIYQSLKARGKHPLAAIGAFSRKLCIIIFTIFRENRPYKTTSRKKGGQNI